MKTKFLFFIAVFLTACNADNISLADSETIREPGLFNDTVMIYLFNNPALSLNSDHEIEYTPKPKAFIKLDFPKKVYQKLNLDCPFIFEFPTYSRVLKKENSCSIDLSFPMQDGVLYISYFPLKNNLTSHTQQSVKLAYKHNVIADGITEKLYINDSLNVYGVLFDYEGITASAAQFYLTDSINHFFRGALYFNTEVSDSIFPINLFLKYDIKHLIETFHWKDK